ncbi:MAG: hypothetical protein ACXWUE_29365 [Polyangiales bacterium]
MASCSSSATPAAVDDTGTDANVDDTASDSAPVAKGLGYIGLQRQTVAGKAVVAANGGFYDASGAVCPSVENHGACQITRCPSGPATVGKPRDAGTVSIVHASDPPIQLTKSKSYTIPALPGTYFKEGDTFVFSSTGADVPAFAGKSVVAPGDLTATLPTEIDRTKDLALTWSAGSTGNVRILLLTQSGAGDSETISCVVPASAGSYTIAKDDLAKLTGATGTLDLDPISETQAGIEGWDVTLSVNGLGASSPVTFH